MVVHAVNYQQVYSLHSRNYLCSLNSLCIDRKVPSTCDMHLPVAVVLLTDPGLSHMEAVTQRRLQTTAKQFRHARTAA